MAVKQLSALVAVCFVLMSCSVQQSNNPVILAGQILASAVTPGGGVQQMTATRAELEAAGITEGLLVATLQAPEFLRAGLLKTDTRDGIVIWRGNDGSTIRTDAGVVLGTIGSGYDLYSSETEAVTAAIASRSTTPYRRTYRHLNALNQLDKTPFFCTLSSPVSETITVYERRHATIRIDETCSSEVIDARGATFTIENRYWHDPGTGTIWRSEQWISPKIGNILLERVFE
jgi:hypothetical protein